MDPVLWKGCRTTIFPIGFKHFVDESYLVRVTTIVPFGFKHFVGGSCTESVATLPPFSPIEGQKWFDQISSQWESQKNRFSLIYFGKIQFLPPCIWNLPFMSTASVKRVTIRIPIDIKHFVDGSSPVERVPDDQNSMAALHCLPLRDQQNFTLIRIRQLGMGKIICQFDPQNY